jgi:hypothetical protein
VMNIVIDAAVAAVRVVDRALSAVENSVRHRGLPFPGFVRPAGADASATAGTGGHPIRSTSDLLRTAAGYVRAHRAGLDRSAYGPYVEMVDDLIGELHDRAANFAAHGD